MYLYEVVNLLQRNCLYGKQDGRKSVAFSTVLSVAVKVVNTRTYDLIHAMECVLLV